MQKHEITDYPIKQVHNDIILRDDDKIYQCTAAELIVSHYGRYLQDACTFAQMCAEIYVDENIDAENKELTKNQKPERWPQRASDTGWEKIEWNAPKPSKGYNLKTLKYAVWLDRANKKAAVVFRGTASFTDWWSNAHWLTRFVPNVNNHYHQVQHMVEPTIEFIKQNLGEEFSLYTSGHSLGGGLAQLFAYTSSHQPEFVCAFHSSPVTGYYQLPEAKRVQAATGLHMSRVFEHGEVLAYPRLFLRKFYPVSTGNPRITEFRTNFTKGGIVTQHSMAVFAQEYYERLTELKTSA